MTSPHAVGKSYPHLCINGAQSCITLEITDVRVERVQEITADGGSAEGCVAEFATDGTMMHNERHAFRLLWDSINATRGFSWESNPWTWVVEFKVAPGERAEGCNPRGIYTPGVERAEGPGGAE